MKNQLNNKKQTVLFYSYSHKDEKFRDALATHLALLKHQGVIQEWYDRKIAAGEDWGNAIDEHLEAADIILLLVSPDFIASDYCWGKEMARALERHAAGEARIIPIIVRPANWSGAPFGRLQALPKNAKPITLWTNRDSAWVDVASGIAKTIETLAAGLPVEERTAVVPSTAISTMAAPIQKIEIQPAVRPGGQLQRIIYNAMNGNELPGKVARSEGDSPTSDAAVDEAYDELGISYNFFWDVYERNSIDDKGMRLEATVHYGQAYNNGFWNGKQIILGDSDGQVFNRFTISIDVIAKELIKGIIEYETHLQYWGQSGALIESISDVFGVLVKQYWLKQTADQADWLIGAGLFVPKLKAKALRSMADPGTAFDDPVLGKDPQMDHMKDYYTGTEDNYGMHINSGIPNHAFYLIATALGGYAWEKAGRIWYEALRDKRLKSNAEFRDFAQITLANAQRLYGDQSNEAQAVKDGWEKVGINVVNK